MEKRSKCFWAVYVATVAIALAFVMAITAMTPTKAHAAELTTGKIATQSVTAAKAKTTKAPYKDATVKWVGKKTMKNIAFVKTHGGYKGIIKGNKFSPYKNTTRGEFVKVLKNLYGSKVPTAGATGKNAKKALTDRFAKNKMVAVAKQCFGVKIYWGTGTSKKLGRATTANYVSTFAHFDKAFMPK